MDLSNLNWLAVFAAATVSFIVGGLWYSPLLFGNVWQRENGFSKEDMEGGNMGKIFGLSFVWSLVMAVNLAMFLADDKTDAAWGTIAGFLAGFGWVAMAVFILGLFERKSARHMLINAGYMVVSLTAMGGVIGAWR